jgi:holliday junction DNA helicase RuvA
VIGRLTGDVVGDDADGTVTLDVAGVGYEVLCPLGTVGRLRARSPSGPMTVHVHTHVREDALLLFGFSSPDERAVFRTLIGVSSVGPKTALAVLSSLPGTELGRVVADKNLGALTAVPGIGKKTAERLLLELRDKLPQGGPSAPLIAALPGKTAKAGSPARTALVSALVNLGFRSQEAERAAEQLADKVETAPLPDLVREGLRLLAR